jgi:hypothetical protein
MLNFFIDEKPDNDKTGDKSTNVFFFLFRGKLNYK